jgi:hypothetical protein
MPKILANLLGEPESNVSSLIGKLEELTGYNSEDVRLLADIRNQTADKIASLGLDPADTTAQELFHALQAKLKADSQHLARATGFKGSDNIDEITTKLAAIAQQAHGQTPAICLTNAAAKSLLRKNPPKKLMKQLRYRSIESMLKRESPGELMAAVPAAESDSYLKKIAKDISKLNFSSYESRPVNFIAMNSERWGALGVNNRPVTYVPLMGTVALWPVKLLKKQESVYVSLVALQAAEFLEVDSFYLKTHQFQPDFGKLASQLFLGGEHQQLTTGNDIFSWHHLSKISDKPQEPHQKMAKAHPALHFWRDAGHLVACADGIVSTHLADNLKCLLGDLSFENRSLNSGINHLKSELLSRYAQYPAVKNYLTSNFDDTLSFETVNANETSELQVA